MKKILLLTAFVCLMWSCDSEDPLPVDEPMVSEELPDGADLIGSGVFESYAHSLAGKAVLYSDEGGKKHVRLEDFTMTAGPDVYVFLSKANNYSKANVLEVARLTTGFNMSEINFEVNAVTYSEEYRFVLVYCVQYSSLFGYTELK